MYIYGLALKEVEKKIDIIRYDYEYFNKYDSIDHVMTRIKSPESILNKLKKDEMEPTYKNLVSDINDVAGIRIICPLKSDIFTIRKYIREFNDINVIKEKDFVTHPKESGYTSYHMVVKVPVAIDNDISMVKVEIQIRSLAMDFWASLEHKIYYKFEGNAPDYISRDLRECAKMVSELDEKMLQLNEAIQECILKESDRERLEGVCRDVIGSREEQKLMSAESAAEDPKKEDQKG